ncbi:hypothetical protein PUR34_10435 [Streptomyces sp. JV185]|uniref:hypothetical protein n=1 Tax=Streptomyces sp. JV185 TaxID=858638 RepID=UPI002E773714|nr:hypothetical protein [Streptomyces sp. JV185]MEE1768565.1 hypothetical protein [Streptomyces sp. JV185]
MDEERRRTGRLTRSDLCMFIATGCLLLAAAAGWSSALFVVLGRVVPGWAVGAVLLLVSSVVMRTAAVPARPETEGAAPRRAAPPRFVRGLLAVVAGLGCAVGVLGDLGSEYHILRPTGPHGCTAVVRETSFLFAGSGDVYAVGPSGVAWRPSGSWQADDGYRPIAEGTYELHWGRDDGALSVRGTEVDPVMDGLHGLDCD